MSSVISLPITFLSVQKIECQDVLKKKSNQKSDHNPIDDIKMQLHHEIYVKTLKSLGIEVTEIKSDPKLPDCVFTEDAAVVCGNKAVVTRLGHPNRRG